MKIHSCQEVIFRYASELSTVNFGKTSVFFLTCNRNKSVSRSQRCAGHSFLIAYILRRALFESKTQRKNHRIFISSPSDHLYCNSALRNNYPYAPCTPDAFSGWCRTADYRNGLFYSRCRYGYDADRRKGRRPPDTIQISYSHYFYLFSNWYNHYNCGTGSSGTGRTDTGGSRPDIDSLGCGRSGFLPCYCFFEESARMESEESLADLLWYLVSPVLFCSEKIPGCCI